MKKLLYLLVALLAAGPAGWARQWTVSNNGIRPGQFGNLAAAVSAALAGDTILIAGGGAQYDGVNIHKKLILIGNAATTQGGYQMAIFNYLTFDSTTTEQSDGSRVIGLQISTFYLDPGADNIVVERCWLGWCNLYGGLSGGIYAPVLNRNVTFRNNKLDIIYAPNASATYNPTPGLVIANNYITQYIAVSGAVVTNNLFTGSNASGTLQIFNSLVFNNIFYGGGGPSSAIGCTFSKNLTYQCTNNVLPYYGNNGLDNLADADPKFVSPMAVNGTLSPADNYALQAGSPAKNAGTDGKDIGPTGGLYPFYMWMLWQAPTPAVTTEVVMTPGPVTTTQPISVQITAKKRN